LKASNITSSSVALSWTGSAGGYRVECWAGDTFVGSYNATSTSTSITGLLPETAYAMELVPGIFLGGRLAMSMALIITVVSEMVFTPRNGLSLGALARDSQIDFNTPAFYACVLFAAIFGLSANMALKYGEHRLGSKAKGDAL